MQSSYEEVFERDMAGTPEEWQARLPLAIGEWPWHRRDDTVTVQFPQGELVLRWSCLPDRVIALLRMPRLRVNFHFVGLSAEERLHFMKRFDLVMQRGGG